MSAGLYNTIVEQGAAFVRQFTVMDLNGRPVDLTNYIAQFSVKAPPPNPNTPPLGVLNYISSPQETHLTIDGSNGIVTITFSADETLALNFTSAIYDIFLVSPSSVRTRLLSGSITVTPSITHI